MTVSDKLNAQRQPKHELSLHLGGLAQATEVTAQVAEGVVAVQAVAGMLDMMLPVAAAVPFLGIAVAALRTVAQVCTQFETNKEAMAALVGRTALLLRAVGDAAPRIDAALARKLGDVLQEIQVFALKTANKNKFLQVFTASATAQRISDYDALLARLSSDLGVAVAYEQYDLTAAIDRDQQLALQALGRLETEVEYLRSDLKILHGKLDYQTQLLETQAAFFTFRSSQDANVPGDLRQRLLPAIEQASDNITRRSRRGLSSKADWSVESDEVDIDFDSCIGEGSFGKIFKAVWRHHTYAAKVFPVGTADSIEIIKKEASVWYPLNDSNVLKLWRVCLNTDKPFIIIDLMDCDLASYLQTYPETDASTRSWFILQLANGMQYLHSQNIIHGDLKANNVLVSQRGNVCITDFGMSFIKTLTTASTKRSTGAVRWIAPEKYKRHYKPATSSDVFAFAMTCIEILTGRPPFVEAPEDDVVREWIKDGERPDRPENVHDKLWDLLSDCWDQNPLNRPNFSEIVRRLNQLPILPKATPEILPTIRNVQRKEQPLSPLYPGDSAYASALRSVTSPLSPTSAFPSSFVAPVIQTISRDQVEVSDEILLGENTSDSTRRATLNGRDVSIKILDADFDQEAREQIVLQASRWSILDHPNVIKVSSLCLDDGNPFLVMPYMQGSDLQSYIRNNHQLDLQARVSIIRDIAVGLRYMHYDAPSHPFIHGDISASHIFIVQDTVKIGFGFDLLCTFAKPGVVVARLLPSPESNDADYVPSKQLDVYAFGIVAKQILCADAETSFESTSVDDYPQPDYVPAEIWKLTVDCCNQFAAARPGFEEVVRQLVAFESAEPVEQSPDLRKIIELFPELCEKAKITRSSMDPKGGELSCMDASKSEYFPKPRFEWDSEHRLVALRVSRQDTQRIPKEICDFERLQTLYITSDRLLLLPTMRDMMSLVDLSLDGAQISQIPKAFFAMTKLTSLNLCGNQIRELSEDISYLVNLKTLCLKNNKLATLPSELASLEQLTTLDVSGNELFGLPDEIYSLPLQRLDAASNQIVDISHKIGKLAATLSTLLLDDNQLHSIPKECGDLHELRILGLNGNSFKSLPTTLARLTHVRSILLDQNKFPVPVQIPPNLQDRVNRGLLEIRLT
eukprot:jgi/Hompol1/5302/HPOL_004321-RA